MTKWMLWKSLLSPQCKWSNVNEGIPEKRLVIIIMEEIEHVTVFVLKPAALYCSWWMRRNGLFWNQLEDVLCSHFWFHLTVPMPLTMHFIKSNVFPFACNNFTCFFCRCLISSHLFWTNFAWVERKSLSLLEDRTQVRLCCISGHHHSDYTHTHPSLLQPFKTPLGLCNCLYLRAITLNWWGLFIPS